MALQYGVPVESLVTKFSHQRFEPAGMTENADIPFAKSLVDYIFRWMGMQFVPGYREANSPRLANHMSDHSVSGPRLSTEQEDPRWSPENKQNDKPEGGRLTVDSPRSVQAFAESFAKAGSAIAAMKFTGPPCGRNPTSTPTRKPALMACLPTLRRRSGTSGP